MSRKRVKVDEDLTVDVDEPSERETEAPPPMVRAKDTKATEARYVVGKEATDLEELGLSPQIQPFSEEGQAVAASRWIGHPHGAAAVLFRDVGDADHLPTIVGYLAKDADGKLHGVECVHSKG
jgi:hypothetical protein